MSKHLITRFMNEKERFDDEAYFFYTVAYHLAPIFTSRKPSSVLTFSKHGRNMYGLWKQYKSKFFEGSAIHFYELKKTEQKVCVLFYVPGHLMGTLTYGEHMAFLKKFGYHEHMTLREYLELLKKRFAEDCPHEVGLFLGVPLNDIKGFIACNGKNYLFSGYWKVYHCLQQTLDTFKLYDQAKMQVVNLVSKGIAFSNLKQSTLERLLVS